jgi:hypothetical protein
MLSMLLVVCTGSTAATGAVSAVAAGFMLGVYIEYQVGFWQWVDQQFGARVIGWDEFQLPSIGCSTC